jgi:cytochrome c
LISTGRVLLVLCTLLALTLCFGCQGGKTLGAAVVYTGGNPVRGRHVIEKYGCGACHRIPGIRNAVGLVGPPLTFFAERTIIAGELPNTTQNLIRWVRFPTSVEPKTAMPTLGLSEQEARDVAAYLYTLR